MTLLRFVEIKVENGLTWFAIYVVRDLFFEEKNIKHDLRVFFCFFFM